MPVDCAAARAPLHGLAARLERQGRRAIVERARTLARLSRAPADHVARHRTRLHQHLRELRASARRGVEAERARSGRAPARWSAVARPAPAVAARGATARRADAARARRARRGARTRRARRRSSGSRLALAAHDPQRTLERGYALVEDPARRAGHAAPRKRARAGRLTLRIADGALPAARPPPDAQAARRAGRGSVGRGA